MQPWQPRMASDEVRRQVRYCRHARQDPDARCPVRPSQAVGARRQAAQNGTTAVASGPRGRQGSGAQKGQKGQGKDRQGREGGARARSLIGQEITRPRGSQGPRCDSAPIPRERSVARVCVHSTTHVARWQGDWAAVVGWVVTWVTWVVRVSGPSGLLNHRSTASPYPPPHPRSIRFAPRAELPSPIPLPQSFSLVFTFPNISSSLSLSTRIASPTTSSLLSRLPACAL